MPIYEYQCSKCGVVEAIQKFTDAPIAKCPVCGTPDPQKVVSASSFHLKGGGWYNSGYASTSKSSSTAETATSSESSSASSASSAKCSTGCKCH